jgi:hypothetical protein
MVKSQMVIKDELHTFSGQDHGQMAEQNSKGVIRKVKKQNIRCGGTQL